MLPLRLFSISLLLAATLWPVAAQAVGRVLAHHVKDLVPGPRTCTPTRLGIYEYSASWTPATWDNKPWQGPHTVNAHNCSAGPVSCTASRCTVKITGCRTGQPGTWIAVTADVGFPHNGYKVAAAPPSRCL